MAAKNLILLVDDTEPLRKLAEVVLRKAGYTVVAAGAGVEALTVAGDHAGELALLITDLTMPVLGGRELAAELRRAEHALPILFLSGTEESFDIMLKADGQRNWWLAKPFQPDELVAMVREILKAINVTPGTK